MGNSWQLYQRHPSFVLGFHGTDADIVERLVSRKLDHLEQSEGSYEWLGPGIYFWENDPQRALEWARDGRAKHRARTPAVVGAIIDRGYCLDLTTRIGCDEVAEASQTLVASYAASGIPLVQNTGGHRELDCQVITTLHAYRRTGGLEPYDTVRGLFPEDVPLYEGAGFRRGNHTQIAVLNTNCILGYFNPIERRDLLR